MDPSMTTQSYRRRLPDARVSWRHLAGLGVAAALALVAAAPSSADTSATTRVTVIGDSIAASFDYVPAARRYLGKGLDLRSDALVCRRLVASSCVFQGSAPATALQVIGANGRALGPVVVINVGYNDWAAVYDVDRVMRALKGAGVRTARRRRTTRRTMRGSAVLHGGGRGASSSPTGTSTAAVGRGFAWMGCTSRRRARWVSRGSCAPSSSQARRPRSRRAAVPTVLHSGVEPETNFPLAAHVSGWTTSPDLSTGRPRAGIRSERMFCSPCTRELVASLAAPLDAAGSDGLTPGP
jgi:hypothetical protein